MSERFLVCGGSGGIGSATCVRLGAAGYRPIVGYARSRERAAQIARSCGGEPLALDLADSGQIGAAVDALCADPAPLAGVVLAASAPLVLESFARLCARDLERHWQVSVAGPHALLAGLIRGCLRKQRRGVVIGVLSQAMRARSDVDGEPRSMPMLGAYAIAKHGLEGLLAALRADCPWLRVRSVAPGFTETDLLSAFDPRFLEQLREREPFATPDQVAGQITALISADGAVR